MRPWWPGSFVFSPRSRAEFPKTGSPASSPTAIGPEGDIDTLATRIAHIRTWTFIANRNWLADPLHWQERARAIEDRLSDALHERLTQRFIDRHLSVLMRRLRQKEDVMSSVEEDGGVYVESEFVSRLLGFRFLPEGDAASGKALKSASLQAVSRELLGRAQALAAAPDPDFSLTRDGNIIWHGAPVAKLVAGVGPLKPRSRFSPMMRSAAMSAMP